jgi:hypothetical protein
MPFKRVALAIILCLASYPASAEERLSMPKFPAGWIEAFARQGQQELIEYVPLNQTAANWQRKISLEIFRDWKNLPLDSLQRRAAAQNRESCDGHIEGKFQSGVNNGYPSAFWTLGCQRSKISGVGEVRYTKVIQAKQGLYILSDMWRVPAFPAGSPGISPQEIQEAMDFLTSSIVCDTTSPQSPCPSGEQSATPAKR